MVEYHINFLSSLEKPQQLEDYLNVIAQKNEKYKLNYIKQWNDVLTLETCFQLMSFNYGKSITYISNLCELWDLKMEIKFTAFEIFSKFLTKLLYELCMAVYPKQSAFKEGKCKYKFDFIEMLSKYYLHLPANSVNLCEPQPLQDIPINYPNVCSSNKIIKVKNCLENSRDDSPWKETIQRLQTQMELRAVTCILIASKVDSHYHKLKANVIIDFLNSRGNEYKTSILMKSEIRILKSLDFDINSLPLVHPYIGAIIESMSLVLSYLDGQDIYKTCLELLLCFYQKRPQVYFNYWKTRQKKNKKLNVLSDYLHLRSDMILLGCTIIASSVYLSSKEDSNRVIEILSKMSNFGQDDLAEFSHVMLETLLS